jgi:arabinoxylan arabinofuranohydrolase
MNARSSFTGKAVAAVISVASALFSLTALGATPGTNPIITDVYTADPAPLVVGNTVYLYTGHDEPNSSFYTMNNWRCYSSPDMTNWTSYGSILSYTNFTWASGSAWAGQCVGPINGRYYWYVPMQGSGGYGGFNIGVAVSDSPTGPFQDARGTPLITDGMTTGGDVWDDIDPTVFTDTNGASWLGWGHGTFYLAQLAASMTNIVGSIQAYHLPYYTEGPWLHRRGDIYYLSYASIDTGSEKIRYATAPSITGPWTPRGLITGNPYNSYTIQDGIIEFHGQSYMFYHNGALPGGGSFDRSVCVDYLYYNPDGTIQPVFQTTAGVSVPPRNDNLPVGSATMSSPANGATNVSWSPQLGWLPGGNAVAHAVYLGTSSNAVAQANFASPEYQGTSATTNCTPAALNRQTTYFWRVDEIRGTNMDRGPVWSFTTGPLLAHRYGFSETGGTSVADSAGGPEWTGTLPNGGALTGSQLTLSPGSQQYLKLPAGIANSRSGMTIMAWVNLSTNANWSRIFDFGNNTTTHMYLTPQNGNNGTLQFAITTSGAGGEQQITSSATLSAGAWHQVAVTLSGNTGIPGLAGSGGTGVLYLDGVAVGTTENLTLNPSSLGNTVNNYIGKSQYGSDPYLNGSIKEFRIYKGATPAAEIANAYTLGSAMVSANLPYPWTTQDIGAVGLNGGASCTNDVFTVTGAGADIQGAADAFRFVCVPVTGDCAIVARVASVQNVNAWSKAGVMIRESLNTNAANAFIGVTPGNGVTWQDRSSAGGATTWNNTGGLSAPYWFILVRSGNTFTGYRSTDGVNWTQQGVATNFMLSTVYAGLALTSHDSSSLCMATFDSVAVPGWTVSAPPVMSAQLTGANMMLSWPLTNADFTLQSCADLASRNWQTLSSPAAQILGGQWQVSLPLPSNAGSTFYRLVK